MILPGIAKTIGRTWRLQSIADHSRAWISQTQTIEQGDLKSLRDLHLKGAISIDDAYADLLQAREKIQCVKDGVAVAAAIGGGAHAVEQQRPMTVSPSEIKLLASSIKQQMRRTAPVEFRK